MNQLAQEFRETRLRMDLGLKQAADMIKRHESTVKRIERGGNIKGRLKIKVEEFVNHFKNMNRKSIN